MPNYDRNKMTLADLETTHILYMQNVAFWHKMLACYEGIQSIVNAGYGITRHERESQANWERRIQEAYGFGYSGSIVDLFNFYLFKSTVKRDMGALTKDALWEAFENDCNLYGDNFLVWLLETQRWACVFGQVGVLVDKSTQTFQTQEAEIAAQVYPYVARYFPMNVLDWEYSRDLHNRPYLSYIKLLDDDGGYRIWTTDWWAIFKISAASTPRSRRC